MKVYTIVLGLGVIEMECHEGLQACIYKGVEVQRVKKVNAKSCVCVFVCVCESERERERERERESLETLNQKKQIVILKH